MKKIIPIVFLAVFLAAGCSGQPQAASQTPEAPAAASTTTNTNVVAATPPATPAPKPGSTTPAPSAPKGIPKNNTQVSLQGTEVCLAHKIKTGPQTQECAIGFEDIYGNAYAVKNEPSDWKGATATGLFTNDTSGRYDIVGVIDFKITDNK